MVAMSLTFEVDDEQAEMWRAADIVLLPDPGGLHDQLGVALMQLAATAETNLGNLTAAVEYLEGKGEMPTLLAILRPMIETNRGAAARIDFIRRYVLQSPRLYDRANSKRALQ